MAKVFTLFLGIIFVVLFLSRVASGESVFIRARSGDVGHGWLFGAPQDGQCWIVVPAHVVISHVTGVLEPFAFGDSQAIFGECAKPIRFASTGSATLADKEGQDLAFARVISGRPDGKCRSRLGLSTRNYQSVMMKSQGFIALSRFLTSASELPLALMRHSVDSFGGAVIEFMPQNGVMPQKGLSGAPIVTEMGGESVPVAMVLSVDSSTGALRALRFDYIKARYNELRSKDDALLSSEACMGNIPYQILYTSYVPADGDKGVSGVQHDGGSWRAIAPKDRNTVDVVLAVNEPRKMIKSIKVVQSSLSDSRKLKFWIDQRIDENSSWVYLTSCTQEGLIASTIRVGLVAPRQLRIRFDAHELVSISSIRLQ